MKADYVDAEHEEFLEVLSHVTQWAVLEAGELQKLEDRLHAIAQRWDGVAPVWEPPEPERRDSPTPGRHFLSRHSNWTR
jgi:hypothetical protein